jgi:hypothetical protein
MEVKVGKLRKVTRVKQLEHGERLCGEGAYVASPRPVHATRLQRDVVLGSTIGSPQAANVARFNRAAENRNTYHKK